MRGLVTCMTGVFVGNGSRSRDRACRRLSDVRAAGVLIVLSRVVPCAAVTGEVPQVLCHVAKGQRRRCPGLAHHGSTVMARPRRRIFALECQS